MRNDEKKICQDDLSSNEKLMELEERKNFQTKIQES
jgi:hypothetical protein